MQTEAAFRLEHIAIIGAGLAGRSFCRHLLEHGFHVTLEDVLPSNLRQAEAELKQSEAPALPGTLSLVSTVEDAVRSADLTIDFVPDELESKLEILSMVDRMAPPRTILLTPTDVLSVSDLGSCTYRPERCFGISGLSRHQPFGNGVSVTLLYPALADSNVMRSVQDLFEAIHLPYTTRLDPHPSLLVGR